ncbi:hypothetical protein BKA70DRAFT_1449576 [Coprinopsis sp. MPI-PUGE-AT-0042]|nr:hypothetical protein BKA70DRAFT_1449576 [Coprinopsis sp. MPI-PUGE-AT-0042]
MASPAITTQEPQPGPKEAETGPAAANAKQRHILDIVFLQDSTGSQGTYIQACKAAITDICNKVSEHMGSPASPSAEAPIRFGLIAFRDHPPQDTSYVTKNFGFTSSVGEMKKWLGGLVASGGGDGPEASTAAMADALNMDWRQSEDNEAEGGKKGVKVVKIVVLVTDAPPHGLGESGDGFPKGAPDQNDPPGNRTSDGRAWDLSGTPILFNFPRRVSSYPSSMFLTSALAHGSIVNVHLNSSGRMVPLLNASQLGDYIIGSALETLATEELIAQFQDTILEDVYGQGKSVEEVVERVQQQLAQQKVQMQTLQVDDVYAPSKEAEANVFSWKNAGKLSDARDMVQEISAPRMKAEYASVPGMGSFGSGAVPSGRMWASTPCGATPRGPAPPGSSAFGSAAAPIVLNPTGFAFGMGGSSSRAPPPPPPGRSYAYAPPVFGSRTAAGAGLDDLDEQESEEDEMPDDFAPRSRKGKASMRERDADRSYAPSSAYGAPPPAPAPSYGASFAMAPTMLTTGGGGGEAKLPQVQMVQQAVSMDQTRRLVMQGLSRHAKVGPGGKLTPKGVWAKADGGVSEGAAIEADGSAEK